MCGIVGWVASDRDLTLERDAVASMTATMACRGPDAAGIWLRERVALGHRRLAVIDVEGGAQPMLAQHGGEVVAALTYNGEVYNFARLRRELQAAGHALVTRSDTEVVLSAYLAWGGDFVTRLNGMFALALWDARTKTLILARDRMGIKPLFYAPTPGGALFGSEPKAILANPSFPAEIDEAGLRELMSPVPTPGASIWRGMLEVPPGGVVEVDRRGCRARTYWSLQAAPPPTDAACSVARTRELLEEIVREQLVSDVPLCALLSGGLDSSAITALAAAQPGRDGAGPVRSFAVDFKGYVEGFTPDRLRPTPDAPFVRDVVAHLGSDHTDVLLDTAEMTDGGVRSAVTRAYDRPVFDGDMSISLYLLFRAVRQRSTVALSGEAADEVFGGYSWFHDADAIAADTFPWLAATSRFPRFSILRPELERRLALDAHLAQAYHDMLAEVPTVTGEPPRERRMRQATYAHLTRYVPGLLERTDRMSMAVGLEVRVPYCDHRLVEFVYNLPWSVKTLDGREKGLLRAAVADLVPGSVRDRRKSHYPSTRDRAYGELVLREFRELMSQPDAQLFELADHGKLKWLAKELGGRSSELATRQAREQVLALDRWLCAYRPRLVL